MDLFCPFRSRTWTPTAVWRSRRASFGARGALEYRECVGDDLDAKMGTPFPRGIKTKPGETLVFACIVYKSRAPRDRVNAKVMKDPRILGMCDPKNMPFDGNRMPYVVSRPSSKPERHVSENSQRPKQPSKTQPKNLCNPMLKPTLPPPGKCSGPVTS